MIRPGSPYGEPAVPPEDVLEVWSDTEASSAVAVARVAGLDPPSLLLRGGDLHRTLGGRGSTSGRDPRNGPAPEPLGIEVPIDLGVLLVDGEIWYFVAHVAIRRPLWSGPFAVAMNAQWYEGLDLGPRSHPGDGLLDITEGRLDARQRFAARVRARSGSHLPHPDLRTSRRRTATIEFDRQVPVHVDGRRRLRARRVSVSVEPQALTVYL